MQELKTENMFSDEVSKEKHQETSPTDEKTEAESHFVKVHSCLCILEFFLNPHLT